MPLARLIATLSLIALAAACRKDIPGQLPYTAYNQQTAHDLFESFWTGMNTQYVWWSQDTVNWDQKYSQFRLRFDSLNIADSVDRQKAVTLLRMMTDGLVDSHFSITFPDIPYVGHDTVSPANDRKSSWIRHVLTANYFLDTLSKRLDPGWLGNVQSYPNGDLGDTTEISNLLMLTGTIGGNIIYFHFSAFAVQDTHDSARILPIWNKFLYYLDLPQSKINGLIFDLRSNGGGSSGDLSFVAGRLISKEIDFGYTRQKSGDGRLDYSPWAVTQFVPYYTANPGFTKPIVVLTDQHTVSLAEITTMALKTLPNAYVIGDTTWGATGLLNSLTTQYNGGQFTFDNFGYARTTVVQFMYHNHSIYEGRGFPPDEYVPYTHDSLVVGHDVQLSAAVNYIDNK